LFVDDVQLSFLYKSGAFGLRDLTGFLANLLAGFLIRPIVSFFKEILVYGLAGFLVNLPRDFLTRLLEDFCASLHVGQGEAMVWLVGRGRVFLMSLGLGFLRVSSFCCFLFSGLGFSALVRRFLGDVFATGVVRASPLRLQYIR
jgi:hypothetical protein